MPDHPLIFEGAGQRADYFRRIRRKVPEFRKWTRASGRSTYIRYLLSTPLESVLAPLAQTNRLLLIDRDLQHYSSIPTVPTWQSALSDILFPKHTWFTLFSLAGVTLFGYSIVFQRNDRRWIVPVALAVLTYPTIFLAWHGDTIETERHAFTAALQWRLSIWLLILVSADRLIIRNADTRLHVTKMFVTAFQGR
jgi:hypothetical protein